MGFKNAANNLGKSCGRYSLYALHGLNPSFAEEIIHLNSGKVLPTNLPFSEAVRFGDVLYISGAIGNVPGTISLVPGRIAGESKQAMENLKTTLSTQGLSMSNLVKCAVFLADISEWGKFNEVYKTYLAEENSPARAAMATSGLAYTP